MSVQYMGVPSGLCSRGATDSLYCPSKHVFYSCRFKLNIAMGQYVDAARDAMEMARLEQEEGNYRVAHDKLFGTVQQLEKLGKQVPSELTRMLSLLHRWWWGGMHRHGMGMRAVRKCGA